MGDIYVLNRGGLAYLFLGEIEGVLYALALPGDNTSGWLVCPDPDQFVHRVEQAELYLKY